MTESTGLSRRSYCRPPDTGRSITLPIVRVGDDGQDAGDRGRVWREGSSISPLADFPAVPRPNAPEAERAAWR
jgi:hypothetical protein